MIQKFIIKLSVYALDIGMQSSHINGTKVLLRVSDLTNLKND